MADRDDLAEARDSFTKARDAWSDNAQRGLDDLQFSRLGVQWTEEAQKARRNRPMLTINRMPAFIRQVVNDVRMNKPQIKVRPVDSKADPKTADVLSGLIRNIEHISHADEAYDTSVEHAASMGFGFFRIDIDYATDDAFDLDLLIRRIANPLTVTPDPRSTEATSRDWNECFVTELMPIEQFRAQYKDAEESSFSADDYDRLDDPWRVEGDIRVGEWWTRSPEKRKLLRLSNGIILESSVFERQQEILVASGLQVTGERDTVGYKVRRRLLTGAEIVEDEEFPGQFIPIIPVYGDEVNEEGKRHFLSLIHFAKDPQRMFNYWRSAATELVALSPKAPYIARAGSLVDPEKWATANTDQHAVLEYKGDMPPQRQFPGAQPIAELGQALAASDDMKDVLGIHDASLGARSNETSGRAILARQREGDVSTFHFSDNLARAISHGGRVLVGLIPHVYEPGRIVRVLGPEDQVGRAQMGPLPQGQAPEQGMAEVFDVTVGKYDVAVQSGPSFTTRREEAAAQMTEMIRAHPAIAPLIGDLLAKNLDWPHADEIGRRLAAMLPPQVQGQNPQVQQLQQAVQQLQQKLVELQTDHTQKGRELDIKAYEAETKRIEATTANVDPSQIQALVLQTLAQAINSPDLLQAPPSRAQQPGQPVTNPSGVTPDV